MISRADIDCLLHLADEVCDESASADDLAKLDAILLADCVSRRYYLDYCRMHTALGLELRAQCAVQKLCRQIDFGAIAVAPESASCVAIPLPSVVPTSSPAPFPFLATTLHATVGYFSSGWPVAYLIATVIFGIGLLVGSLVHVSQPAQVARQSVPLPSPLSPLPSMVGRITGMVDCKWVSVQGSEPKSQGSNDLDSCLSWATSTPWPPA